MIDGQKEMTWSQRWVKLYDTLAAEAGERTSGRAEPSHYRLRRLEVHPGVIEARLVDATIGKCKVEIRIECLHDEQWQRVVDLLANQPLLASQLIAGDLPSEIESFLASADLHLMPHPDDVATTCTCQDQPTDCHAMQTAVQEVFRAVGAMFDDDAWLLWQLRGRGQQRISESLREQRTGNGAVSATSHPQAVGEASDGFYRPAFQPADQDENRALSLENEMENYWGSVASLESFHYRLARPQVDLALLRRLGPPLFEDEDSTVYDAVAAVYQRVTEQALALAYAAEPVEPAESTRKAAPPD